MARDFTAEGGCATPFQLLLHMLRSPQRPHHVTAGVIRPDSASTPKGNAITWVSAILAIQSDSSSSSSTRRLDLVFKLNGPRDGPSLSRLNLRSSFSASSRSRTSRQKWLLSVSCATV